MWSRKKPTAGLKCLQLKTKWRLQWVKRVAAGTCQASTANHCERSKGGSRNSTQWSHRYNRGKLRGMSATATYVAGNTRAGWIFVNEDKIIRNWRCYKKHDSPQPDATRRWAQNKKQPLDCKGAETNPSTSSGQVPAEWNWGLWACERPKWNEA